MAQNHKFAAAPIRPRQKRGTGFPHVSLPEAAAIIKEAGAYGTEHTLEAMAAYMGHDTTNSGPFKQKIAAFRDWKLITGIGETISISELGRRISHPTDRIDEENALREAFQGCAVFWKIYESSAKGRDLDLDNLGNAAIRNHGISAKLKDRFLKSFKDSASTAGFAEVVSEGSIRLHPESAVNQFHHGVTDLDSNISTNEHKTSQQQSNSATRITFPILSQRWPIKDGEIELEIRSNNALRSSVFDKIGEVIEKIQELVEVLDSSDDQESDNLA